MFDFSCVMPSSFAIHSTSYSKTCSLITEWITENHLQRKLFLVTAGRFIKFAKIFLFKIFSLCTTTFTGFNLKRHSCWSNKKTTPQSRDFPKKTIDLNKLSAGVPSLWARWNTNTYVLRVGLGVMQCVRNARWNRWNHRLSNTGNYKLNLWWN